MERRSGPQVVQTSSQVPSSAASLPSPSSGRQPQAAIQSYPAIVHAAVFSAFLVPIAFLPYLAARRHITKLRRTVEKLERDSGYLKRALDLTVISTRAELERSHGLARSAVNMSTELRKEIIEQDGARRASEDVIAADLRKLLLESQHSRTQAATLRALGMSLADVAAFMQEVELDFGMETVGEDRRGIQRLRLLALRMQSLSQQHEHGNSKEADQPNIRT